MRLLERSRCQLKGRSPNLLKRILNFSRSAMRNDKSELAIPCPFDGGDIFKPENRIPANSFGGFTPQQPFVNATVLRATNYPKNQFPRSILHYLCLSNVYKVLQNMIHAPYPSTAGKQHIILVASVNALDYPSRMSTSAAGPTKANNIVCGVADKWGGRICEIRSHNSEPVVSERDKFGCRVVLVHVQTTLFTFGNIGNAFCHAVMLPGPGTEGAGNNFCLLG